MVFEAAARSTSKRLTIRADQQHRRAIRSKHRAHCMENFGERLLEGRPVESGLGDGLQIVQHSVRLFDLGAGCLQSQLAVMAIQRAPELRCSHFDEQPVVLVKRCRSLDLEHAEHVATS